MSLVLALKADPSSRAAFEAWYRETYPKLFLVAYRVTSGNRAAAEDLCQEAILSFMTRGGLAKVEDDGQALAYLRRTVSNAHINSTRREGQEVPAEAPSRTTGGVEEGVDFEQRYHRLWTTLDTSERKLLRLMIDGHSIGEIAQVLGLTYSYAGVRVYRMRNKIKALGIFETPQ
jgi:RNA polymerase sigma factor (sigma-70 family)